jgi:hypothetical protein
MPNKGGFSWKRATGITKAKQNISRKTGIPMTKSGRQRKLGAAASQGCVFTFALMAGGFIFLVALLVVVL